MGNEDDLPVLATSSKIRTLENPIARIAGIEMQERVAAMLATLPKREAEVLRMRFGIGAGEERDNDHTLEEIGQKFNVTRERIRQIENKALARLQKRGKGLQGYLDTAIRNRQGYGQAGSGDREDCQRQDGEILRRELFVRAALHQGRGANGEGTD